MKKIICFAFLFIVNIAISQNYNSCIIDSLQSIGKKTITDYNIYLSGEIHYKKGNDKIKADLFKQLYKYDKVRIWVFELSYCEGIVLNDYFENNNDLWIKKDVFYPEERESLIRLKKFYDSLPKNDKFRITGVDYEKGVKLYFLPAIQILSPKKPGTDTILEDARLESTKLLIPIIEQMKKIDFSSPVNPEPFIKLLKNDILKNESLMINYWGNNYIEIKKIIYQYEMKDKVNPGFWSRKIKYYKTREEYIYNNILELHNQFPDKKIYGQFGRAHTIITKQEKWDHWENWESFAAKCNTQEDSPFKNKVESIYIYYSKTKSEKKYHDTPIDKEKLIQLEKEAKNNGVTLFDLKCVDSVYYKDIVNTKFQYLIINKY